MDPNRPGFENGTLATFHLIESIVGAFGGFAQMLESTYMATHSSFFAMVSMTEQLGHLRTSLGSILGIYAILRWMKRIVAKIQGKPDPTKEENQELATKELLNEENSSNFQTISTQNDMRPPLGQRPSYTPLLFFMAAVIGIPYLIGRMIRSSIQSAEHARLFDEYGNPRPQPVAHTVPQNYNTTSPLDPATTEFCRALYDFVPETPNIELELHKGDIVALLARHDSSGRSSEWWHVRSRDGRSGYVPATFVEVLPRQDPHIKTLEGAAPHSPFSVEEFQRAALQG